MTKSNWAWYAGRSEDEFQSGPFSSREEAVEALEGEPGFIIEAYKKPIELAQGFDAATFLDECEEHFCDLSNEYGEPLFDTTAAQQNDLERRVREAISGWQEEHKLVFFSWYFTGTRGLEYIHGEVSDEEPSQ